MKNKIKKLIVIFLFLIIGLGIFIFNDNSKPIVKEDLEVNFIDVGQGDSTLIRNISGKTMLIDGGSKKESEKVLDKLKELDIKKIDYLIATHPHEDHIGGLPDIIRNIKIGTIYMPRKTNNTKIFEELLLTVKEKDIRLIEAKEGVNILNDKNIKIDILGPGRLYSDMNNNSVIIRLDYFDTSFIFTGDLEAKGEKDLLERNLIDTADVLKVGHHGSDTSTSLDFLEKINPEYGIISVGRNNSYGHPNSSVLERLDSCQVKILRTDILGDITLISDGKSIVEGD